MKGIITGCVVAGAVASAIVLGGCSESFCAGSGCSISGDTVAHKADEAFAKKPGLPPLPPVTCPDSLDNKVGATTHCFAKGKFNGKTKTLGITAKMTSKHGSEYHLDFQTTGFEK
jgi:hypothetical protein